MRSKRIIIPGAAGLVGQNLVLLLKDKGYHDIVAIDKHPENTAVLRALHPDICVLDADVSKEGDWQNNFKTGDVIIMLQAQIGSKASDDFVRNNIRSTELVLDTAKDKHAEYIVHISSSVVESVADDDYTNTKKKQEELVVQSRLPHCVLRPTLMFGWFDRNMCEISVILFCLVLKNSPRVKCMILRVRNKLITWILFVKSGVPLKLKHSSCTSLIHYSGCY